MWWELSTRDDDILEKIDILFEALELLIEGGLAICYHLVYLETICVKCWGDVLSDGLFILVIVEDGFYGGWEHEALLYGFILRASFDGAEFFDGLMGDEPLVTFGLMDLTDAILKGEQSLIRKRAIGIETVIVKFRLMLHLPIYIKLPDNEKGNLV